jgi:hypothetical protein
MLTSCVVFSANGGGGVGSVGNVKYYLTCTIPSMWVSMTGEGPPDQWLLKKNNDPGSCTEATGVSSIERSQPNRDITLHWDTSSQPLRDITLHWDTSSQPLRVAWQFLPRNNGSGDFRSAHALWSLPVDWSEYYPRIRPQPSFPTAYLVSELCCFAAAGLAEVALIVRIYLNIRREFFIILSLKNWGSPSLSQSQPRYIEDGDGVCYYVFIQHWPLIVLSPGFHLVFNTFGSILQLPTA